jgi:hypothetical protein
MLYPLRWDPCPRPRERPVREPIRETFDPGFERWGDIPSHPFEERESKEQCELKGELGH